jgi:pyruvate-formate lyase-activating enzyme
MSYLDAFNLLSKLSPRRAWNVAKVYSSFYLTRWLKKPIQWGLPFSIAIEPTTACNLRCPECPSGLRSFSRPTGNLKSDFFRQLIDELHREVFYLTFYFQGEPYINPEFLDMVKYANQKGIYTATSTNAHFLNNENAKRTIESGLDRLIISIDGTTQETYEAYRKQGKLSNVIQGAKNIVKWKKQLKSKTPHIIFQFLVVKLPKSMILSKAIRSFPLSTNMRAMQNRMMVAIKSRTNCSIIAGNSGIVVSSLGMDWSSLAASTRMPHIN